MAEFPLGGPGPRETSLFPQPRGVTQSEQPQTKLASHPGNPRTSGNLGSTSFPRRLRRRFIPKSVGRRLLAVGETANEAVSSLRGWPRTPLRVPEVKDICLAWFSADGLGAALTQPGLFSVITEKTGEKWRGYLEKNMLVIKWLFFKTHDLHL